MSLIYSLAEVSLKMLKESLLVEVADSSVELSGFTSVLKLY